MKMHRSPSESDLLGDMIIARRNPDALWLSGYEDRIIYDGRKNCAEQYAGLLSLFIPGISAINGAHAVNGNGQTNGNGNGHHHPEPFKAPADQLEVMEAALV